MIINATDAWILHRRVCGETSADLTFFTREKGLIKCRYKGARSPKKQAFLQPFTPIWLTLNTRYERYYVQTIETEASSLVFKQNHLFAALYVNELIYYALSEHDTHKELYDVYSKTLHALHQAINQEQVEIILRRFEQVLLLHCGYAISFTEELSGLPIQHTCYYELIANEGFKKAERGFSGAHILAIASDSFDDAAVLKTAKWVMRQSIHHLLDGRVIKARELYFA